ncbi:MAG: ribonuclease Y [Candidatus Raymondbacteria bacterium RifOxyA12_full_50_37]|uniref:Ribonuclease Y n=1 Tax=Candidatus Raymondbacteria bacterium RIFOXYD12_FULL_49_13 TaxID=1817890 RepID=A0A1F7F187_UNCRA|nr:MAG: ribonuclease Y [Candidatus Raymondbacteria bacterium RifOxyA12_full_50_37]OGJ93940.1 MAG: ribonuclease Y [Candidatus Raymondbacteria bacterium RIFOXYA2_FULL_49_16]OGJ94712.1 MAG: ribonuclease Y [Candidatus Raymondbacteria bacterium RifOxyC12_full_50_8]OGJ98191.1 MAG: ribonuclease Y [Candidatus Raymondbacteria bacterium RIFOXYC2_FULL_50_21]OGK00425.1 MAG: ribonuclease Y [Candidatus Raymondbacteria bacterium RIFOXYD12_FULL_49_13]OGP45446.1 MAG: ribonuclease Y [Candidatus Raymondbacteria 
MSITTIMCIAGAFIAGVVVQLIIWKILQVNKIKHAKETADMIVEKAKKEAELEKKQSLLKAKDEWFKVKSEFEKEMGKRQSESDKRDNAIKSREGDLNKKVNLLKEKEQEIKNKEGFLTSKEKALRTKDIELSRVLSEQNQRLESIAGLTQTQAKETLKQNLEVEVRHEAAQMIKKIKDEAKETGEIEAQRIITIAIQRCAAEHTIESTVSTITLPSEEIKGRIIGREGRNIRAFEEATGIDVIVDDTPENIVLSGYDPVKREIARVAMEKLIADGRIHPTRIEEIVGKTVKEIEKKIKETGEQVVFDLNLPSLHPQLVEYLGRLNYRTSFGQNVLRHSKEVAVLSAHMASELGLDPRIATRAGILHDIGKAIDRESEGTHAQLGAEVAKKFGENEIITNAIAGHHEDVEPLSPYPILIQAADAISATRPGARMETFSTYVKRLEQLEEIAESFKGVDTAYALQAGREIRVMVNPVDISDAEAEEVASQIAKKVEADMDYPGQIKVTVIREKRIIDYAK